MTKRIPTVQKEQLDDVTTKYAKAYTDEEKWYKRTKECIDAIRHKSSTIESFISECRRNNIKISDEAGFVDIWWTKAAVREAEEKSREDALKAEREAYELSLKIAKDIELLEQKLEGGCSSPGYFAIQVPPSVCVITEYDTKELSPKVEKELEEIEVVVVRPNDVPTITFSNNGAQ